LYALSCKLGQVADGYSATTEFGSSNIIHVLDVNNVTQAYAIDNKYVLVNYQNGIYVGLVNQTAYD